MEEYGQAQADWFEQFLALPHGISSPDTFRRVLSRLKPEELAQCFINWTDSLRGPLAGETGLHGCVPEFILSST